VSCRTRGWNDDAQDWYIKGDDDTFFLVDNMLQYLKTLDPLQPVVLGRKFRLSVAGDMPYDSGGAGYVVSRAGLELASKRLQGCAEVNKDEYGDVAAGACWTYSGLQVLDTRDEKGRERFHPFDYSTHLKMDSVNWGGNNWYERYSANPLHEGFDCCDSLTSVSFHYMHGKMRAFRWPPAPESLAAIQKSWKKSRRVSGQQSSLLLRAK